MYCQEIITPATYGAWSNWVDCWDDDLTSGFTAENYHVRWEISGQDQPAILRNFLTYQYDEPYGPHIIFDSLSPDSMIINEITVKCIIDDYNRNGNQIGSPSDAPKELEIPINVWEMSILRRSSGYLSTENDGSIYSFWGGGVLGELNLGDLNGQVNGFYNVCEFVGTVPAGVPSHAYSPYLFRQMTKGTIRHRNAATQEWTTIYDEPNFVWNGDHLSDGNDPDTRSPNGTGQDTDKAFAWDVPGINPVEINHLDRYEKNVEFMTGIFDQNNRAVSFITYWNAGVNIEKDQNNVWHRD
jgi:hypothetical protein